jgi:hypothetical protein
MPAWFPKVPSTITSELLILVSGNMNSQDEQALLENFREAASISPADTAILLGEEHHTFQVWVKDPSGNIDEYRGFEKSSEVIEVFRLPALGVEQQKIYDRLLDLVHKAQERNDCVKTYTLPVLNLEDHPDVFQMPEACETLSDIIRPEFQLCVNRLCTELICDGWLFEIVTYEGAHVATIRPWRLEQAA